MRSGAVGISADIGATGNSLANRLKQGSRFDKRVTIPIVEDLPDNPLVGEIVFLASKLYFYTGEKWVSTALT